MSVCVRVQKEQRREKQEKKKHEYAEGLCALLLLRGIQDKKKIHSYIRLLSFFYGQRNSVWNHLYLCVLFTRRTPGH